MYQTEWQAQFSITGSAPKNTDEAVESFIDINGDGLPDKILSDKKVRLNLGYAFTEPIDWELDRIQSGKSLSYNIGASGANKVQSTRLPVVSPQDLVLLHLKAKRNTTLSTSTLTVFQIRSGRMVMVSLLPSIQATALTSLSVGRVQVRLVNQPLHQSLQMQRSL